jgi:phage portal protein BeeE
MARPQDRPDGWRLLGRSFSAAKAGPASRSRRASAMKLSAWFAGVRLTAQTIASLPGSMYERTSNGDKVPVTQHDMHWMLHDSPNADQTAMEFWEGQGAGLAIVGNSLRREGLQRRRRRHRAEHDADSRRRALAQARRIAALSVHRSRQERLAAGRKGLSHARLRHRRRSRPVADRSSSSALSGALATEKASAKMFGKGMRAAGFMMSPTTLTAPQRDQLQKKVIEPITGPDGEGAVGVLEAGFKWQPANIPPKDAEMICRGSSTSKTSVAGSAFRRSWSAMRRAARRCGAPASSRSCWPG